MYRTWPSMPGHLVQSLYLAVSVKKPRGSSWRHAFAEPIVVRSNHIWPDFAKLIMMRTAVEGTYAIRRSLPCTPVRLMARARSIQYEPTNYFDLGDGGIRFAPF